jgi:hypothetical protein
MVSCHHSQLPQRLRHQSHVRPDSLASTDETLAACVGGFSILGETAVSSPEKYGKVLLTSVQSVHFLHCTAWYACAPVDFIGLDEEPRHSGDHGTVRLSSGLQ